MRNVICCIQTVIASDDPPIKAAQMRGSILDPRSAIALEQALRLKEQFGSAITVVAVGGEELTHALRESLSLGADQALRIDSDSSDMRIQWQLFANCICNFNCGAGCQPATADLILCAASHSDVQRADGPPQLAELCGWPLLPNAETMEIVDQTVHAVCRIDNKRLTLQAQLPAVVSVHPSMNIPRLPKLSQILRAKNAPIGVIRIPEPPPHRDTRFHRTDHKKTAAGHPECG